MVFILQGWNYSTILLEIGGASLETRNVLSILQSRLDRLPPSWKRLGDFLLTHLDQAVFLTASDLARHAKTSESSVVRFARGLGYQGYPELREDLQVLLREKLRPVERMVQAGGVPSASGAVVARVFELALSNIQDTRKSLDSRHLQAAAAAIAAADTKHIIGLNASAGTAHLLGHHLGKIQPNVRVHIEGGPMLFDALLAVSKRDVVVGIFLSAICQMDSRGIAICASSRSAHDRPHRRAALAGCAGCRDPTRGPGRFHHFRQFLRRPVRHRGCSRGVGSRQQA